MKSFGMGRCRLWRAALLMGVMVTPNFSSAAEVVQILLTQPRQLTVPLHPRPSSDGSLTLGKLIGLLQQSGQKVEIVDQVPFVRALKTAETSSTAVCIPLLLHTPEREGYLVYTDPILQAEPLVVLHRRDDASFSGYQTFDEVLKDSRQILGWRQGTTLGADLEQRMAVYQPALAVLSTPATKVCDMVTGGRASYCLMSDRALIEAPESVAKQPELLQALRLDGAPLIEPEAIGCNRATPAEFIGQVNGILASH